MCSRAAVVACARVLSLRGNPVSLRWLANEAVSKRRGSGTQPRRGLRKVKGAGKAG